MLGLQLSDIILPDDDEPVGVSMMFRTHQVSGYILYVLPTTNQFIVDISNVQGAVLSHTANTLASFAQNGTDRVSVPVSK